MSAIACPDPAAFLAERDRAHAFAVREVPLASLPRWRLGETLRHDTGRFFTIEGVAFATSVGPTPCWTQPIINQPEIGILGFLGQRHDGVLHLLAQAKMEPGNRTMVQYSPTVQATPSNYERVHQGRSTPYLEHFLAPRRGRVLLDQLQSEQGSRYLRKRNRNIVIEVPQDEVVPVAPDFTWLTLEQLRTLLASGNAVNLNARTVLGCLPERREPGASDFSRAVAASLAAPVTNHELGATLGWMLDVKTATSTDVRRVGLHELDHWICDEESIRHESGRFFRVLGVSVVAGSREIETWAQPMISPTRDGTIAFVCQRHRGVLEFLVQARAEPGLIDGVELGATLQFSPGNYDVGHEPPLAELLRSRASWVRYAAMQSEDGGRFYHDEKMHLVIEVPEDERVDVPAGYRWMTLALLEALTSRSYHVTVEARSLLACLR